MGHLYLYTMHPVDTGQEVGVLGPWMGTWVRRGRKEHKTSVDPEQGCAWTEPLGAWGAAETPARLPRGRRRTEALALRHQKLRPR